MTGHSTGDTFGQAAVEARARGPPTLNTLDTLVLRLDTRFH